MEIDMQPASGKASPTLELTVKEAQRVLDTQALTVLGVLLTVGLTVGFKVGGSIGLAAGFGSVLALAVAFRCWPARKMLIRVADLAVGHRDDAA